MLGCLLATAPAVASPFTVEDLLQAETLGAAAFDPSGRRLIYEWRGAYASARRFDYDQAVVQTLSRLRVVDASAPGAGRPLLRGDPAGVVMAAFSPSGARLAVLRIDEASWRLGVVSLTTGSVRWLPITPQGDGRGRNLQWRDDRTLLVLDRPDGRGPLALRQGSTFSRTLTPRWAKAAAGRGAHTAYGSGAYLGVRDRGARNRLLQVDVSSGAARVLAEGQFTDLELSPDRRRVALLEAGPDLQPRGEAPVRGPAGSETEASSLSVLDLDTGVRRGVCGCDISPQLLSWSPRGTHLLVFSRGADGLWPKGRLLLVDPATAAARQVGRDVRPRLDLNPATVWTAWLGETPLVYGRTGASDAGRDDWLALLDGDARNLTADLPPPSRSARLEGADAFRVWAGDQVWQVSLHGPPRALAEGKLVVWRDLRFGAGSRLARASPARLRVSARQASGAEVLLGFGAERADPPVTAGDTARGWADASAAGVGLVRHADDHGVESLDLIAGGKAYRVAALNLGWEARDPPRIVPVRHPGPAGEPVVSWVFLPGGSPAKAPLPLLVRAYPGATFAEPPGEAPGRIEFYQNLRVLTGRGYAVLVPSLPNPPGGMVEPADGLARRLLDIVQAAINTDALAGRLDPDRMALMGHSFGGYAAMTAITQTDCFRAAVSMNGLSDLTSYWSSIPAHLQLDSELAYWSNWHTGVVERTQPELQVPPWRNPERYVRNSPLFAADRIHTPLLLIHGGQDGLSLAQSEAMYSALFRQGKDALLLVYWGAMHMPSAPGDVADIYAQTFRFLDDHLGPPTPPAAPSASPEPASASDAPTPRSPPPTGCPRASPPR
ncbi:MULTISPECIES: prolyl oligopeptidase family serine peptidase [unclassified Phenylobacterium]|uniref:S9 family peptidase n=1 Tax=unclassified Phenylobacterium TaxID=2640670 RepID=UPI0018D223E8|nr:MULTISPECIES: prolyl oligopeptidase family serine peptidase [unclassified Phenylobacterium]